MLRCPKHPKISDYGLDLKLCGEIGCDLCPRMPRFLQIHDGELTKEVLIFCPLQQLEVDGKTFIPINECHSLMDNASSLADEMKDLENVRGEFKENGDELAEGEKRDGPQRPPWEMIEVGVGLRMRP